VIPASSARQAKRYQWEIHRREEAGKVHPNVRFMVVRDVADQRLQAHWRTLALSLDAAGADVRPFLAHAPGIGPLAETGNALCSQAMELEASNPTEASSRDLGLNQRLRGEPVPSTDECEAELERLTLLFYTGIWRVARDLLQQVVGSYPGRETACVQVLHSSKTLAMEFSYAIREGDWELNQPLDANATNALINLLLQAVRPFTRGVKLAGAGGGGFLILLAPSDKVQELRQFLSEKARNAGGAMYEWHLAREALRVLRHKVTAVNPILIWRQF
jgi:hypothetical protein